MIPIVSVIGWHDSGKTTFIERLIKELKQRGVRVATLKHTRGDFQVDRVGTDTWRFAQAGSDLVAISGKRLLAFIEPRKAEMSLSEIVSRLPSGIDLLITEGYKRESTPKIEVIRRGTNSRRIALPKDLLALVTDGDEVDDTVPTFAMSDVGGVADLLEERGFFRTTGKKGRID